MVERDPVDAQRLGRLRLVPGEIVEHAHDVAALERVDAEIVGALGRTRHRQVVRPHQRLVAHHHRALDDVLQLAHVPRPVVRDQQVHGRAVEAGELAAHLLAVLVEEEGGQQRHVAVPVAQRRQVDGEHVEAVEQVRTEAAFLDQVRQVAVGGRDYAEIHVDRLRAAHAHDFALLEHPQQVGLRLEADVGDLVQKHRASGGGFELALLAVLGAGERALLVSEQFALNERFGERAAVDHHHGVEAARAQPVNGAGHQLLAGAAFALDHDGGIDPGHGFDLFAHLAHGLALPHQLGDGVGLLAELLAQDAVLALQPVLFERVARHHGKIVGIEGLGDVIERAVFERPDRGLDRGVTGHHDDAGVELLALDLLEQLDAVHARHADVGDRQVELAAGQLGERIVGVGGGIDVVPFLDKPMDERVPNDQLIIHDEDR